MADNWDGKLNTWVLAWDYWQSISDPDRLFHANIFHPARYALAFSENLYGVAVIGFPLFALGASPMVVYNFLLLLGMCLSGLAAWALARYVTDDVIAPYIAGIVYAFTPWRIARLGHFQFQWGCFLAFSLLFLLRFVDRGRRRDAVLFGVAFAWNAACNVHYALFAGVLVVLTVGYEIVTAASRAHARRAGVVLLIAMAAGIVVLPLYLPYWRAAQLYGFRRDLVEVGYYSARPIDFVRPGGQNKLYAFAVRKWGEGEDLFPGLTAVALAVLAAIRRRVQAPEARAMARRPPALLLRALDLFIILTATLGVATLLTRELDIGPWKLRDPWLVLAVLAVLVILRLAIALPRRAKYGTLGQLLRRLPGGPRTGLFCLIALIGVLIALGVNTPVYRFLHQSFGFAFRAIRVPARGIVLFHLGLSVLAACGLQALLARTRPRARRAACTVAVVVLVCLEYRAFPVAVWWTEDRPAPVYAWLRATHYPGAMVECPFGLDYDVEYVFRSTAHFKPLLNGYSGFFPPHYNRLNAIFTQQPIPDTVWSELRTLGARLVAYHPHYLTGKPHVSYARALRRALEAGELRPVIALPHMGSQDYVMELTSGDSTTGADADRGETSARAKFLIYLSVAEAQLTPPFGWIDFPHHGATVSAGQWGFGWALDDSGVSEIRLATHDGPAGVVTIGGPHPGVKKAHPGYPDSDRAGFGFAIPRLPRGMHALYLTIVAKDGGETVLGRWIRVR